jgi:hypothetical protein
VYINADIIHELFGTISAALFNMPLCIDIEEDALKAETVNWSQLLGYLPGQEYTVILIN